MEFSSVAGFRNRLFKRFLGPGSTRRTIGGREDDAQSLMMHRIVAVHFLRSMPLFSIM
jgi:hypothetical protein